jgi:alpha 1,2-mannosyltransferase
MVRRVRLLLAAPALLFVLWVTLSSFLPPESPATSASFFEHVSLPKVLSVQSPPSTTLQDILDQLLSLFREIQPIPRKIDLPKTAESTGVYQGSKLDSYIEFNPRDLIRMEQLHANLLQRLPDAPSHIFSGRGIVTVAGGKYARIALLSLRLLRRYNTTLPMEIWMMDHSEYDLDFCDEARFLGAKCRLISDFVGDGEISNFQLKAFAILLSSFAEVLYLDADNFPLRSVDDIFTRGNYTETGVVLWPDYWAATVSPWLFNILNRPQKFMRTCETGQLLWNKRTHFKSLALACYYNYYGPNYFYPLLSLGAAGQGDKETFLMACEAFGQSYTFIETRLHTLGYHDNGEFFGTGMGQADPRNQSQYLFMHAHWPKMNGQSLFKSESRFKTKAGGYVPSLWGATGIAGFPVEIDAFEEMAWIECNSTLALENPEICERVLGRLDMFEEHTP